jgi:hypothetical protein
MMMRVNGSDCTSAIRRPKSPARPIRTHLADRRPPAFRHLAGRRARLEPSAELADKRACASAAAIAEIAG